MGDSTNNYLFRLYFGENIKTMDKSVPTLVLEQRRKKEGYKLDNEYYDLVLNGVKFSRKIYEPGLIEAEVTIDRIFYALDGTPLAPSVDKINNLFLMRRVELGIVNQDELNSNKDAKDERIARNYYVYKLNTQMTKGTGGNLMTVKLTIHSMDKLMTLDKYSKCYTAKKLGAEILEFEARSFGFKSRLLLTCRVSFTTYPTNNLNTSILIWFSTTSRSMTSWCARPTDAVSFSISKTAY